MKRNIVCSFLLFVLAALPARAQNGPDNDPDAAQGYVNSFFHHSSVDSINLYNGQLTIPIALGPSYPVGPKLRFQAMLTYTSRAWEFGHPSDLLLNPPPPALPPTLPFEPLFGDPALGIGWNFSLGAIKPCGLAQASNCYVSPDGAEHLFDKSLENPPASHFKTRDGSQLYLHYVGAMQGYEMWDGDGNHYVFDKHVEGFDDPVGNYYHDFGRGRNGWYLGSLMDPFGNGITVTYWNRSAASPCPSFKASCPNTPANPDTSMRCSGTSVYSWVPQSIRLPGGSLISIGLDTQTATAQMIKTFTFPVFANGLTTSAVWQLNYQNDTFGGFYCAVPLVELASLDLPNSLFAAPKYLFQYAALGDGLMAGTVLLTRITVPTGASIQYDYGDYSFYHGRVAALAAGPTCQPKGPPADATVIRSSPPVGGNGPSPPSPNAPIDPCVPIATSDYIDTRAGVLRKTETISAGQTAVTNYTQYAFPFGEQGAAGSGNDKSQTLTIVVGPADVNGRISARSVLFWSGPRSGSFSYCSGGSGPLAPCPGDRTGAELREAAYDHDPNTSSSNIPMPSCGVNDLEFCPSHGMRVLQRTFDYDVPVQEFGNRRVLREVAYHQATASNGTCAGCQFHQIDFSPSEVTSPGTWEANGRHHNTEAHTGNLGNDGRTITTNWTPVNWNTTPSPGAPALPNLYSQRTESDSTLTVNRYFEFNNPNGFLNCSFTHDPSVGRVSFNRRYPSGDGTLYQDFTATATGFPAPPTIGQCTTYYPSPPYPSGQAIGTNSDAFGKIYTYQNGLLTSARWINGNSPGNWYAKRLSRDSSTGWITTSYDTAGLATGYAYDALGRVTSITPPGGEAATTVSYPLTTRTTAARNGGIGLSTSEEYDYDGLGRLLRETHLMPAGAYAVRAHAYDGPGHQYFDSEWALCSNPTGDCQTATVGGTQSSTFDPFGRPQTIVRADGSTTNISYADSYSPYSDTKKTVTVNNIGGTCSGGACSGGSSAATIYASDGFGRLTSVVEPDSALTSYTYDVNDKLTRVSQAGLPDRTFTYDPIGFLRSESTPEKGSINYTTFDGVSYQSAYGSLGNLLQQTHPGSGLARGNCYDFAGRITQVRTNEGGVTPACSPAAGRLYLQNVYDDSGSGASAGRLLIRTATNYAVSPNPTVTDTFGYDSATGRLASQQTQVSGSQSLTASQSWKYNGLGLISHHYHPRVSGQLPFVVSTGYDAGLPVTEYVNGIPMVKTLTYQPSGALAAYTTGIGTGNVTTTITQDSKLPRPASISAVGPVSSFSTGSYAYDGAGNINAMGSDVFAYDSRSRLTSATVFGVGSQAYSYDRYGNMLAKAGNVFCSGSCANNQISGASYLRGNLTNYAGQTFSWDGLDRMVSSAQSSLTWNYLYDGDDERAAKVPPTGTWTFTIRDESKRVASEYSSTTTSRDNVFLGNQLTVSYANLSVGGNDRAWSFYSSDHLGTPRLITDITGAGVPRQYWPLGDAVAPQGSAQALRFAAMEFDAEGGTGTLAADRYYDHARSHVGGLGRFLSPDRVGGKIRDPQSWNRYTYALNNPLKYVDANGLEVTYADKRLQALFARLSARFAPIRETLDRYTGPGKPDLLIQRGDPGKDQRTGDKALGVFTPRIEPSYRNPDGSYTVSDPSGKDQFPSTGKNLTGAALKSGTLTVGTGLTPTQESNTAVHELGHADSAARDPMGYLQKGADDQETGPDGKPLRHDDRPLEKEANRYRERVCGSGRDCPQ